MLIPDEARDLGALAMVRQSLHRYDKDLDSLTVYLDTLAQQAAWSHVHLVHQQAAARSWAQIGAA